MATSISVLGNLKSCPFCTYKGLGNHLQHCGQRNGRDYRQYLAPKTLKKAQIKKKTKCPKCSKLFLRLDTHLRKSTICRSISPPPSLPYNDEPVTDSTVSVIQHPEEAAIFEPQNSNAAEDAIPDSYQLQSPVVKSHLLMPKTTEGWEAANEHFNNILVPKVLAAPSLSEKYSILTDGIYSYFLSSCGTKPIRKSTQKSRPPHNSALKEVTRKKKLAKQEQLKARKQGFPPDVIQMFARQFFSLVRDHSRLKKLSSAQSVSKSARDARNHCHKHFTRYANEVLDNDCASTIRPQFDAEKAHHFFSTVTSLFTFAKPSWMPSPPPPGIHMDCSPFTISESFRK